MVTINQSYKWTALKEMSKVSEHCIYVELILFLLLLKLEA